MALNGNLRDFSVTQLLNLVNLARKTGSLVIEDTGQTAQMSFRDGRLSYAHLGNEDGALAYILRRNNKITVGQFRTIQARASHMSDKELGLLLINAGYLSQDDIINSVQQDCVGIVRQLFTWVEGYFHFETNLMPPDGKITVRVALENLIIEGARQIKEIERLQEEIPSLEMALKFTERPGTNLRNVNLSVEEWRVISYVNPKNSIRQIARATKMSDLEIRRIVYSLLQAGLVEMVRPDGLPAPTPGRIQAAPVNKEEQRGLINRLINRIRSL